jgi:hypothetical protein
MPPTWKGFRNDTAVAIANNPIDSNFDDDESNLIDFFKHSVALPDRTIR